MRASIAIRNYQRTYQFLVPGFRGREQAIRNLMPQDLAAFRQWFADFDADHWDRQMEQDVVAGRLDWLAEVGLRDLSKGRCTDL